MSRKLSNTTCFDEFCGKLTELDLGCLYATVGREQRITLTLFFSESEHQRIARTTELNYTFSWRKTAIVSLRNVCLCGPKPVV